MMKRTLLALPLLVSASCTTIYFDFYTYKAVGSTSTGGTGGGGMTSTGGAGGALLCAPGATQPCYDGPPGTEGVGLCAAGMQTCAADGASWGVCAGEILPKPEDCATPFDEDCDGTAPACKGNLLWAERFGDASDQYAADVASDLAGNIVLTGNISGTTDFGGGLLTSAGGADVFVTKLDPSGGHLWSKQFGANGYQTGYGVAMDPAGNVIVTGNFTGTMSFGGAPLTASGPGDVFVVKLDGSGAHQWSKRFGTSSGQVGYRVAVDGSGNVLLVGVFYGTIDFGGGVLTSAGAGDIFVAKLDPDGNHVWSKRFGDVGNETGYAIAADGMGNVFLTGTTDGAIDFGGGSLAGGGGGDIFVTKLDPAGGHLWSKRFGDAADQVGYALAVDGAGSVSLSGMLYGAADFGGGLRTSAGGSDIFVAKLDTDGGHLWSAVFGDAADQSGADLAAGPGGEIALTGMFNGLVDFGGGPLTSAGLGDFFVVKLDSQGGHVWSRRAGAAGQDSGTATTIDGGGHVVVTGNFAGLVDFGGGPLTSAGGSDIFVAKLSP
jgi:hypothetical protein